MKKQNQPVIYGVFSDNKKVYLIASRPELSSPSLFLLSSSDGYNWSSITQADQAQYPDIIGTQADQAQYNFGKTDQRIEGLINPSNLRVSRIDKKYFLINLSDPDKQDYTVEYSSSTDLIHWDPSKKISGIEGLGMVIPGYRFKNQYVLCYGQDCLNLAFSSNLKDWNKLEEPILKFEKGLTVEVGSLYPTKSGILLIYLLRGNLNGGPCVSLRTLILDKRNPQKIIWPQIQVLWDAPVEPEKENINFVGVVELGGRFISYWELNGEILALTHFPTRKILDIKAHLHPISLERSVKNPILKPKSENIWESKAVFNPAAVYEDDKVHILYRAIGNHDTSVLGYASSSDGTHIDERLPYPVYVPTKAFECGNITTPFCSIGYLSGGGGYGGCEDPRIVKIEDKFYMTYVAFNGADPPRVALTSIKVEDFLSHKWNWSTPVLISPPGVVNKNACILPEKINGKYVIFHRIFPDILIDYADDLDFDGETKWLEGHHRIKPRPDSWDSRKIGVGAPPIKTGDGWLLIYQAVGDHDAGRYKMGAMLLDLKDPSRVLYRSDDPILEPDEHYENDGHKSGVVYPCGAVKIKDDLFIYYGGADTVVCAAKANFSNFIHQLKYHEVPRLKPVNFYQTFH